MSFTPPSKLVGALAQDPVYFLLEEGACLATPVRATISHSFTPLLVALHCPLTGITWGARWLPCSLGCLYAEVFPKQQQCVSAESHSGHRTL